jgi:hypothetical protein
LPPFLEMRRWSGASNARLAAPALAPLRRKRRDLELGTYLEAIVMD